MANDFSSPPDAWEDGRETPDVFRSLQDSFYPGSRYASDYDNAYKYDGPTSGFPHQTEPNLSASETIEVAQNAVQTARQGMQQSLLGEDEQVGEAVKLKLTIDLSRQRIEVVPEEVIQILRKDCERLVLSHNQICSLPYRFSECTALTYLNLRANRFKEFPKAICKLPKLQILDLSRNKLTRIPEDISSMRQLRVLSVMNNSLERLPLSIAHLESLRIIKLAGNPLSDGLKGVVDGHDGSPSFMVAPVAENEKDTHITSKIKQYLKAEAAALESDGDSSESPLDTPRPLKRNTSLRFPVIPANSGSESAPDLKSPGLFKPPIPARSHYRVPSGPSSALQMASSRRPGVSPLLINSERNRSNSESILQATQNRNKRMGIVTKRNPELGVLDEPRSNRNSFHYRGLSHGSVLKDRQSALRNGISSGSSNPGSPGGSEGHQFVRRLSSLPEHKSVPKAANKIIEGAKGVLYSLHLVHPLLGQMLSVVRDNTSKRSSLERIYYNTSTHLEKLDQELHSYDNISSSDEGQRVRSIKIVGSVSRACIQAYQHVGNLLLESGPQLIANGDERYIRTLLLLIQGATVEGKNARTNMGTSSKDLKTSKIEKPFVATLREDLPKVTVRPITPLTQDVPHTGRRLRSDTANGHPRFPGTARPAVNPQSAVPLYINGRSRSNSRSNTLATSANSSLVNTPRSGESFSALGTGALAGPGSILSGQGYSDHEQDAAFEKIYLNLSKSAEHSLSAVPMVKAQFARSLEMGQGKYAFKNATELWSRVIGHCQYCVDCGDQLKRRLSTVKLKDPEVRGSSEFWRVYTRFANAFIRLVDSIKEAKQAEVLPADVPRILKPVHNAIKLTNVAIQASPWASVLLTNSNSPPQQGTIGQQWPGSGHLGTHVNARLNGYSRGRGDSVSSNLASPFINIPATPLSAALGPAAQATIPTTPSLTTPTSAVGLDRSFQGDVFQRAESYLALQQTTFYRRER